MIKVNAIGDTCPIPVIKTKKAIQEAAGQGTIEVLVDNEIAVQNVTKMAASEGGMPSRFTKPIHTRSTRAIMETLTFWKMWKPLRSG